MDILGRKGEVPTTLTWAFFRLDIFRFYGYNWIWLIFLAMVLVNDVFEFENLYFERAVLEMSSIKQYMFPFDKVRPHSKIIIYGAGKVCGHFVSQMQSLNYCVCLFIADKNYKNIQNVKGIDVCAPEQIKSCEYDKIVIASVKFADEIYNTLLELNVPDNKIVHKAVAININSENIGKVYINDFSTYTPKYRESLQGSKIGEILNDWYANNKDETLSLLQKFCSFKHKYEKIPFDSSSNIIPRWINGYIPPFDAISIYGFLALRNPRYYVEVGSGNTTMFASQSIRDNNLRTKIISIDPFPRVEIDQLCHEIHRVPFEDMDLDFFSNLSAEDILLLDNSHRSFPNSDVTVFFTEVLPKLPSGILYAMHDIFLPKDYPDEWSNALKRWFNEQYLLCAYLIGGADGDKIKLPLAFLGHQNDAIEACTPLFGEGELFEGQRFGGGFFWLEKA